MIVNELFDKADIGQVFSGSEEFHATKDIGNKHMIFSASRYDRDQGGYYWELEFTERVFNRRTGDTESKHRMTKTGEEFKVMAFVMSAIDRFISKYDPEEMQFTADLDEPSRVSAYNRMLKRFASDYNVEKSVKQGVVGSNAHFKLTKKLAEGMMKRSDPWISGARSGPRTEPMKDYSPKPPAKKTPFQTRVANLAKLANVPETKVRALYDEESKRVDPRLDDKHRYSTVWSGVKKRLGLAS